MNELRNAINGQIANLNQLKELLETELHLISGRDAEALLTLLKQKETLLEDIQRAEETTAELFAAQGAGETVDGETQALVDEAKALLEQCKFRTDINTKAVEQGQLKLEHLRNTLVEIRAKESLTYDKSGKPNSGNMGKGVSA